MKALLRSSVFALVVFAGYAAFSSTAPNSIPTLPSKPCQACLR